ncbi:MAG: branched-chain amino acid ABC transporter permease [Nitriliruptorales bacterium]|nr:branched-chain amino acid ABC transporter permease [Nitriliruptorales bacterium]
MAVQTDADAPTVDGHTPEERDPRVPWRPSQAGYVARGIVWAIIIAFVIAIPHLVPDTQINIVSRAALYGIVALSMNVLLGYAGQVSLGHQAFFGIGAFGSGYIITEVGMGWIAGIIGATIIGGLFSLLLGAIALRVRGFYFAIVTIAFGLFTQEVIFNIRRLTGGGAGMPAERPEFFSGDIVYAYVCIAALVVVWLFDWRLTATKAGRAIEALRDDERVAASWGINVKGFMLLAFAISGAMAGLAGGLFASIEQVVSPVTFNFTLGLLFMLMTVVGGLRSRPGVVTGGIVFAALPFLLEAAHGLSWWPGFIGPLWEPLIGAVLLLLTLIFFPGGIAQQNEDLYRWLSFQPFHSDKKDSVGGVVDTSGQRP